jgi:hypothetical protein
MFGIIADAQQSEASSVPRRPTSLRKRLAAHKGGSRPFGRARCSRAGAAASGRSAIDAGEGRHARSLIDVLVGRLKSLL